MGRLLEPCGRAKCAQDFVDFTSDLFQAPFEEITEVMTNDWADANFSGFDEARDALSGTEYIFDGSLNAGLRDFAKVSMMYANSSEAGLWKALNENDIPPVKLASLLWLCMETGLCKDSKLSQVECGASAATAYVYLSATQGANVFNFFHGFLIQKAVEVWRLAFRVLVHGARSVEEMTESSKRGKKKKGAKKDDEDAPVHDELPRPNMRDILMNASSSLYLFLGKVALSGLDNCALSIADFIRDIARIDQNLKDPRTSEADDFIEFFSRKRLDERSFALMHCLSHGRHGDSLVYERCVLPRMMLWSWENSPYGSGAMPMSIVHYGDSMMKWLERRIEKSDESEMECIDEILYALLTRCPDRSDYRSRLPVVFVNLLSKMPKEKQYEFRGIIWDHSIKSNMLSTIIEICALMIEKMEENNSVTIFSTFFVGKSSAKELYVPSDFSSPSNIYNWSGLDPDNDDAKRRKMDAEKKKAKKRENREDRDNDKDEEMEQDDESGMEEDDVEENQNKSRRKTTKNKSKAEESGSYLLPAGAHVLFRILVDGCVHASSTIRMRSLHIIGNLLGNTDNHMMIVNAAYELIHAVSASDANANIQNATSREEATRESKRQSIAMSGGNPLFAILECTSKDFKSQVRKAAVLCIANFLPHAKEEPFHVGMMILQKACRDEASVVRRQAAASITALLPAVKNDYWHSVADVWISEVFPMIGDAETAVAEMVAGLVLELVLQPLLDSQKAVDGLAAEVLAKVYAGSSSRSDLIRALKDQQSHHKLKANVVANVQNKLKNASANEAHLWTLLDCLLRVFPDSVDAAFVKFIVDKWFNFTSEPFPDNFKWHPYPTIPYGSLAPTLLGMIRFIHKKISCTYRERLLENIEAHIFYNSAPTEFLNEMWLTLATLRDHQKDGDIKLESEDLRRFAAKCYRRALELLKSIWTAENLFQAMKNPKVKSADEGEAYLCRVIISSSLAAQYNIDLIYLLDDENRVDLNEPLLISFLLKITTSCYSDLRDNLGRRRTDLGLFENANTSLVIPTKNCDGKYELMDGNWQQWQRLRRCRSDMRVVFRSKFPDRVRAAAAAALGSHCLLDDELARDYLPEIIKEMQGCPNSTVRLNLLVPCCDMVKRYPSMAEDLSPRLGTMLLDPHPLVRAQALEMLTHLIKEQFVKWEGVVMHIYTIMCVDPNAKTATFAQNALKNALLPIMDDMLYSNFMEFLLYYNNAPFEWDDSAGLVPHEREKVNLIGAGSCAARFVWRQTVIRFLLSTFNDQQRFGSMVRMCTDIILPITTGKLNIEDPIISSLLNDCLELMSCEEMDIAYTFGKRNPDDGVPIEDDEPTDAVQEKVKEAIMMAFRKGIEQRILPILFDLLSLSEKKRLGAFARKTTFTIEILCKDHVEHLEEMLKCLNPHMAPELIREMKSENGFLQIELARRRRDKEQLRIMHITASQRRDPLMPSATPRIRRGSIIVGANVERRIENSVDEQMPIPINPDAVVVFNDVLSTSPLKAPDQKTQNVPRSILRKSIRSSSDQPSTRIVKRKSIRRSTDSPPKNTLSSEATDTVESTCPVNEIAGGHTDQSHTNKQDDTSSEATPLLTNAPSSPNQKSITDEMEVEEAGKTNKSSRGRRSTNNREDDATSSSKSQERSLRDSLVEKTALESTIIEKQLEEININKTAVEKCADVVTENGVEEEEIPESEVKKNEKDEIVLSTNKTTPASPIKEEAVEVDEQKENDLQEMRTPEKKSRKRRSLTTTGSVDETVYGGRAFSTPKANDNADLTFLGLDMSVIQRRAPSEQPK